MTIPDPESTVDNPGLRRIAFLIIAFLSGVLIIGIVVALIRPFEIHTPSLDFAAASRQPLEAAMERFPGAFDTLGGSLHLSLVETDDWPIRPYALDPRSGEFSKVWPRVSGAVRTPTVSPVDPRLSVVSAYPDDEPGDDGYTYQLFLVDTRTGLPIRQLTTDAAASKRMPQWSPDGTRVAYHALSVPANEIPEVDTANLDSWNVLVTDIESGKTRRIASGAMPLWSFDGSELLYTNERGLGSYSFEEDNTFQVFVFGNVTYVEKIGINRAGDLMAWTNPNGTIQLYQIKVMNGVSSPELVREIDTGFVDTYWPVFSPDDRYLAVQAIDRIDHGSRLPRVVVMDLEQDAVAKVGDLSGFDFLDAYISDWTSN